MSQLVGHLLGDRYFLREFVASGGAADVYLAWDKERSAQMAIKVLSADNRFLSSFRNEARLLGDLQHPNIVRFYELAEDHPYYFIVMDWIEGGDLRDDLKSRRRPYSLQETGKILSALTSGLNYAHQKKVIHCDIKPSNILINKNQQIFLTDFGIARIAKGYKVGGTLAYMAPEQIVSGKVSVQTDIYALGVTLYEMMSGGNVPFRGDSDQSRGDTQRERIEWEHQHLPPPAIKSLNPLIPYAIEEVVLTALKKDPAERYRSTVELREAFESAQTAKDLYVTSYAPIEPRSPRAPKNPTPPKRSTRPIRDRLPTLAKKLLRGVSPSSGAMLGNPYLLGRRGELAGKKISISPNGSRIGRSSQCALHLTDKSVSRLHATIWGNRKSVYIRDEKSTFGTLVNKRKINRQVLLKNGDLVQIGKNNVFEFRD